MHFVSENNHGEAIEIVVGGEKQTKIVALMVLPYVFSNKFQNKFLEFIFQINTRDMGGDK